MPALSPTMTAGNIASIKVKPGVWYQSVARCEVVRTQVPCGSHSSTLDPTHPCVLCLPACTRLHTHTHKCMHAFTTGLRLLTWADLQATRSPPET